MRALVVLGSSSTITPSPNHHHHHHHKPHKSTTTTTTRHSLHKPLPVTTPLRSTASRHSSLLSYYADLAAKHADLGHLQDFASVAEYVIISGIDASHFVAALSAKPVAKGISENIRRGNLKSVVEALKKLEKLGVSTVNLLDGVAIESLRKECVRMANPGDVEELVDLLETLAGFSFSIKQLVDPNYIVKLCVDKRNPELAMRFAFIVPRERILLCDIINEFGKRRDLDSALIAYQRYKERMTVPNMYVFRTIIDVCGLCGDHMRSRSIYEDLLHRNITPNIYVFNSLMNVNAHDLSYALRLYKSMQNLGVTADVASYNILLKACCLAGRVDLAQDIYREVKQLQSAGQLKLDVFTYCTIIKAFADAKLWQMALKIKEDMLSSGVTPNMFTWSSLISACANAGLVEQAMRLFQEMIMAGCEPNAQCFNIILHACVEARQYDRAFRLFQFWKGRDVQGTLGENYSGNKSAIPSAEHTSQHFVSTVPNPFPNSHHVNFIKKIPFTPTEATYNILMKACGSDYHRAKSLIDEMQKVGLSADQVSWSILIDICGSSNDVDGAVQILKNMRAAGVEPDVVAYTTAIKVCVESKNLDLAFSLFSEMKRYQLKPNLVTYNTLLRARTRYGSLQEIQQSLAIYQDMRKTGYKSNDYYLKQLIEEWCEGVIQDEYQSQDGQTSHKTTELWIPHGLFLERVAAHLQTSVTESLAINIQGLTKVEARIVVLAVLRMIKEEYISGHFVKDDMWITIGINKLNVHRAKEEFEVKDAIQELLQNELGLEVLSISPRFAERLGRNRKTVSAPRRPIVLERLKVTKNSLHDWLQRRVGDIRR